MLPKLGCLLWRDTVVGCGPPLSMVVWESIWRSASQVGLVWWGLPSDEPQGGANGDSKINREIRNGTHKSWNI